MHTAIVVILGNAGVSYLDVVYTRYSSASDWPQQTNRGAATVHTSVYFAQEQATLGKVRYAFFSIGRDEWLHQCKHTPQTCSK